MPSQTSAIGGLTVPVSAGTAEQAFDDPAVSGILDFLAFITKDAIDARLANHAGAPSDAVPVLNRFPFDPQEPRAHTRKLTVPALWVWWEGDSVTDPKQSTTIFDVQRRVINAVYAFDSRPERGEMIKRAGMMAAVNASWRKAAERQRHPSYGYGSSPNGTPLAKSISADGGFAWNYIGGQMGRLALDDSNIDTAVRNRGSGRDYEALHARFMVWERVEPPTLEDPADVLTDILITINASDGETGDAVDSVMQRVMQAPDGSPDTQPDDC